MESIEFYDRKKNISNVMKRNESVKEEWNNFMTPQ